MCYEIEPLDDGDFAEAFRVQPKGSCVQSPEAERYLKNLARLMDLLRESVAAEKGQGFAANIALAQAKSKARAEAVELLRLDAEEFVGGTLNAGIAADNVLVIRGMYKEAARQLAESMFVVEPRINPSTNLAEDLLIRIGGPGTDAGGRQAPPEKQALFVDISNAVTVIKAVCAITKQSRASNLLDIYLRKLAGIGRVGLQESHVDLANSGLRALKDEFLAHEAARIKNHYVLKLGQIAFTFAAILFGLYGWFSSRLGDSYEFFVHHRIFLLAAGGAAIGTWVSFSIRHVTLQFEDLHALEADLLDPAARVLLVIVLTVATFLLFWTGAINIQIGSLDTTDLRNPAALDGAIAVLIGVFCGIAERSLATVISGRASSFVTGLSSSAPVGG